MVSKKQSVTEEVPLTVTAEALAVVLESRALEDDPSQTGLKVAVNGSTMNDFTYTLELLPLAEVEGNDMTYTQGDHDELTVVVPTESIPSMKGATLDVAGSNAGGLVIRNPNTPDPLAGLDLEAHGELPDKVKLVIEQAVNPSLASHGGYVTLLGVDDNKVYLTMGGGCQGCAASAMTLKDGIRTIIMDALPEITDIVDATDHSAGENPFYT